MPEEKFSESIDTETLEQIAELAAETDQERCWPAAQLRSLTEAGVSRWDIPEHYGGLSTESTQMSRMYLDVSAACLTTSFVLSQRNAAVQRIVAAENEELKERLLPGLAAGETWATVGISHLSTSRQHLGTPSVAAREVAGGYVLNGFVPWVTGVRHADVLVSGGTLEDGRQVLVALPSETEGIQYGGTAEMLALTASATGNLNLENVFVEQWQVVAGPVEQVMKSGGGGTGSLTTSVIATGVAVRAVRALLDEAESRSDLEPEAKQFERECDRLVDDILATETGSTGSSEQCTPQSIRTRANSLVLRSAQAYLTAAKGSGFVSGHLAERTIRESMFFLVWSCPAPVAQSALREFACTPSWS
ncbi:acyl-CoA dehydrogenase family protein [Rubinisphaera margarita]|uniref:acyl-CoA dehydrogenase family protein n=1 Tax=Rubinisphaera margarita TaxID=2909586 RepID=UPI001EE7D3A5|nr:acyl-CoA dehydrogenase family protein [Rubinisphaera margarita]MCG6157981.1 acyl-CoA/acyl-ACP dehydrogenase [Rubinisphaera margarita]